MSRDSRIGIGGLVLAFLGIALPQLWPDQKWLGGICLACAAYFLLWWLALEFKSRMNITLFIVVGAVVGGLVALLIWRSVPSGNAKLADTNSIELSLTCDTVNLPLLYRGEMWALDTIFLKGLVKFSPNPLKPDWFWPEKGTQGTGFRCILKNHGTEPAFGVAIRIEAMKRAIVHSGDKRESWNSGDVIDRFSPVVEVPQPLGQQGQDAFTFYLYNYNADQLIEISLPSSVVVNRDDPSKKSTVPLRISSSLGNPFPLIPVLRSKIR